MGSGTGRGILDIVDERLQESIDYGVIRSEGIHQMTGVETGSWFAVVNAGWFGTLVGFVLFVVGIAVSLVLYRRSKSVARLRFAMADETLVNTADATGPGLLEIRYDDRIVSRVTSTSVGIWNAGTTTFKRDDVVASDCLRLVLSSEGAFLQGAVEASSREVNGVGIAAVEDRCVLIEFDYLDPGDGFRLRLTHSGPPRAVDLKGTLRGLPGGLTPHGGLNAWRHQELGPAAFAVLVTAGVVAGGAVEKLVYGYPGFQTFVAVSCLAATVFAIAAVVRGTTSRHVMGVPVAILEDDVLYGRLTKNVRKPD